MQKKEFKEIILAEITPNPNNPRKNYSGPQFDEFVASVRKVGVLQPITIMPVKGKVPYTIVFGERRWRAANLVASENGGIKKNTIPAIIKELTDDEAFDLMTIENLQREDLTELEEAQSFKLYLDKKGKDALPDLAGRIGKSPSYIARRVRVLSLPKEVLKSWEQGKILYGHCEQLARLTDKKEIMAKVVEIIEQSDYSPITVKDLKIEINNQAISLSAAKFDTAKTGCKTCQFNSDVQRKMFDDDIEKSLCTDPKCFKQTQNNWLMENWKNEFKKKTGTNAFRFLSSVLGQHNGFYSNTGKPNNKCKECQYFVSLINIKCEIVVKQSCVGDKSCYNAIIAAGKKQEQKKAAAKQSKNIDAQIDEQENNPVDIPRVPWHGGYFIEQFYKTAIPERFEKINTEHNISHYQSGTIDKIMRVSLISLLIANMDLWRVFVGLWMADKYSYDEEQDSIVDKKGEVAWNFDSRDIWARLIAMNSYDLVRAHQVVAAKAIMQQNKTNPSIRHLVARHLGIELEKEWRINEEYLEKKTTKEILAMITDFGIDKDTKALAYLHETLNKKQGKFNTCKKAELVDLIMKSGIDLAGMVPAEILNAAKQMETTGDEE